MIKNLYTPPFRRLLYLLAANNQFFSFSVCIVLFYVADSKPSNIGVIDVSFSGVSSSLLVERRGITLYASTGMIHGGLFYICIMEWNITKNNNRHSPIHYFAARLFANVA